MRLKIRVILDAKEDVFRDIVIDANESLLELHQAIKQAFGLEGEEMASFYLSNDEWFQGSEIPMENIFEEEGGEIMKNISLKEVVPKIGNRMIYVYDFLNMWTFFCETVDSKETKNQEVPAVTFSLGELPAKAPEKGSMDIFVDEFDEDLEEDDDYIEDDYDNFYY